MQEKLKELKNLHSQGLISDEVYAQQQKDILNSNLQQENKETNLQNNETNTSKKQLPWWQLLVIAVLIVLGTIWMLYKMSDKEGKDAINQFASQTGIGTQVIPWADRAETIASKLIEQNQQSLAKSIQNITHPSGEKPQFVNYRISKLSDRIQVEISVAWKGGFTGDDYQTSISWEVSESNHILAKVISDTAIIEVESKNKEALDDFFKTKVYPAFYSNISGNPS